MALVIAIPAKHKAAQQYSMSNSLFLPNLVYYKRKELYTKQKFRNFNCIPALPVFAPDSPTPSTHKFKHPELFQVGSAQLSRNMFPPPVHKPFERH